MRNETSAFACAILTLVPCSLLLNRTEMLATQANTSLVSIAVGSGEPVSASVKTSNLFCSRGLHPLDPSRALPLYPTGGLGSPQTLRLVGGLRHPVPELLNSLILLLLEIFLTTLDQTFVTVRNQTPFSEVSCYLGHFQICYLL